MKQDPSRFRAAYIEGPPHLLLDDPQASVRLHPTIKAAEDELRARRDCLVKQGYSVTFGTLGKRIMVLERDTERRVIGLDKLRRG